ncbi:3-hydroxyanthranilate 3,4-dioxygenase [Micromonospora deserti]|uniref:3-hydroxyanthranilate 3,4-dioxygenase n=1 Tax=Micromonospora deserti TaxID=2070366 RepID=A0A2W2EAH2_9ACTN|nr:cupin domain-containing protein [Micromonospora deserti]PZG01834.1 3-hydroxyanthranilate 3,4-dioxygenase [Micromonospora deserti]
MTQPNETMRRIVDVDALRKPGAAAFPGALAAMSLYPDSQFEVVLVRGPNQRNDFHVDPYDELFIQLEGTIRVDTREPGAGLRRQLVHAGELYVVPAGVPHSPLRPADTWGLVVEIRRKPGDVELVEWYCDQCDAVIERVSLESSEMIEALGPLLNEFQSSEARRTCKECGSVLPQPGPFVLDEQE